MSGTYPSTPEYTTATLTSVHRNFVSVTQSGARQVRTSPGHFWAIKVQYPKLVQDDFMDLWAFAIKQKGQFESFQFVPLELATPRGALGGTPLVNGASQTGSNLVIDGCSPNIIGWMKAGDVFKVAGHTKVYMVTEDVNTDGGGNATLGIQPDLMESPANNEALTVTSVPFTVAFRSDSQLYNIEPGTFYGFAIDLIEVY